jgi:hypothetical protein
MSSYDKQNLPARIARNRSRQVKECDLPKLAELAAVQEKGFLFFLDHGLRPLLAVPFWALSLDG